MKRLAPVTAAVALVASACPAGAWGPVGHRITAQIAQDNVSGHTRAKIDQILGREGLPEASTWPDEQRSGREEFWRRTSYGWHFVTLKTAENMAHDLVHPPEGDAVTAIEMFTKELRDPATPPERRELALRFLVHIIGDLHQPLHVGKDGDRGGNDIQVLWFDNPVRTNLHWVWDVGMIEKQALSFSEYSERLEGRMTPEQVVAWWETDPNIWLDESIALRNRIYPAPSEQYGNGTAEAPFKLQYIYTYDWNADMELRLQQAGIRMAAYLDWVFAEAP